MRLTSHLVAVAVLVAACGEPVADVSTTTSESVDTSVTLSPTATTTSLTTSSTIEVATTSAVDVDDMSPEDLVELLESIGAEVVRPSLAPGQAIDPPADFPAVEDLTTWADGFSNPGHQRALITSYLGPKGDPGELIAGGMMFEVALGSMVTITCFDGITVWDYGAGVREVSIPGQGIMTRGATGDWAESTALEWPVFGPIPEQHEAQSMASAVLAAENEVVSYERIAGVETIRVRYAGEGAEVDVWVSADALVMRLIYDTGDSDDPATMSYIWNVETLDAVLDGPLPPGI